MKSLIKILIATAFIIFLIWALVGPLAACDTWVALKGVTLKGISLFAKNSDSGWTAAEEGKYFSSGFGARYTDSLNS